jgi:hypothetical protein
LDRLKENWQSAKSKKEHAYFWSVLKTFRKEIAVFAVLRVVQLGFELAKTTCLYEFIKYLTSGQTDNSTGLLLLFGLVAPRWPYEILTHHIQFELDAINVKLALAQHKMIFEKNLKISESGNSLNLV